MRSNPAIVAAVERNWDDTDYLDHPTYCPCCGEWIVAGWKMWKREDGEIACSATCAYLREKAITEEAA